MRWPTTKAESDYLRARRKQNLMQSASSKAESWAFEILRDGTGLKWTRQSQWGYRIFDFWNAQKGIAVELDGPEHRKDYDAARDKYNYERSGILVLRVKNFDTFGMTQVLNQICAASSWAERRAGMDLKKAKRAKSGKDKLNLNK